MKRSVFRPTKAAVAAVFAGSLVLAACSGFDDENVAPDDADADVAESDDAEPEGDPIVIGMVNDTSGGASAYSPYGTVGIEMAIEKVNDEGGVAGQPLSLISESDGSDSTQTSTLARRLIDKGADVLLFNSASGSAVAAKGVCVEEEILCVAPTNLSAEIIEEPDNEFIYILGPTSAGIGAAFAEGMTQEGYERLAIVSDDNPTIQGYVPSLAGTIIDAGVEEVAHEKVPDDASDVSPQIARVKDADPDVILVMSLGGQVEATVQNALSQQLPDVPRFSLASIGNQPTTWDLASPGALEGLIFAGSFDTTNPRTQELEEMLEERGGEHSELTAYGAQGYDSLMLVAEAIEIAGGADDGVELNSAFQQVTNYQPHYGQDNFTISYGEDKHEGSDGDCGLVLAQFDAENRPGDPWDAYQPSCD